MAKDLAAEFGFTRISMGDHVLARFLRKHKAIDNWHATANANTWRAPDGRAVVQAHYHGGTDYTLYVRSDLAPTRKVI
jgi:hypothetical protein